MSEETRKKAREVILDVLDGGKTESRSDHDQYLLRVHLGTEEGDRLLWTEYSAVSDLVRDAIDLKRLIESVKRDFDKAVDYLSGKPGYLNNLGIVQGNGSRIDVAAALFHRKVEDAIVAVENAIEALDVADHRYTRDSTFRLSVQTLKDEAKAKFERQSKEAKAAREAREAREAEQCVEKVYRRFSSHRCPRKGKHVITFDDGSQERYCGQHLKSGYYAVGQNQFRDDGYKKIVSIDALVELS